MPQSLEQPVVSRRPPFWWAGYVPAVLGLLVFGWLLVVAGGSILVPLLLGFALTFMLEPLVGWLEQRGRSRHAAVLLTLLIVFLVGLTLLLFLVPSIFSQLRQSFEKAPLAIQAVVQRLQGLLSFARTHLSPEMFARVQHYVNEFEQNPAALTSRISTWLSRGLLGLVDVGSSVIGLLIVPFFVYYLLLDLGRLKLIVQKQIPPRHRQTGMALLHNIGEVVRGYVRGRFLIACIMASMYSTGLLILRVPLWAGIGLIAGIIGIIPYLGVTSGLILALGFTALDGAGFARLGGVMVVFAIAQLIEDYVLTPRIIGGKLELHPMLVFIALIIAGDLYGILGMVLAIPGVAVAKVILSFFEDNYLQSDFYRAAAFEPIRPLPHALEPPANQAYVDRLTANIL